MLVWVAGLQLQKEVFNLRVVQREKSSLSASDELPWGGGRTDHYTHPPHTVCRPYTYTEYQLQAAIRLPFDCNVYSVPSYKC